MDFRIAALAFALTCAAWPASASEPLREDDFRGWAAVVPVSFQFATREEGHELRLTNVHVVVRCPVSGKLFEGVSEGPFLVANLPDGNFEVVASHEGRARHVALSVAHGEPRNVAIYW